MDSILLSIKKLLGPGAEDTHFDPDITLHINTALSVLTQLGVGPREGFAISGSEETWGQFLGEDPRLSMVKSYVYAKVKLLFDPPQSSAHAEALKSAIAEFEWRANCQADPGEG